MNVKSRTLRRIPWIVFLVPLGCLAIASRTAAQEVTEEQRRNEAVQRQLKRLLEDERREQSKRDYQIVVSRADLAATTLDQLLSAAQGHAKRMETLLRSDEGKRLAADPVSLIAFVDILDHPVVTPEETRARRESIASTIQLLKSQEEMVAEGYRPGDAVQDNVQQAYFWANENKARLDAQQAKLDTIIAKAPPVADPTSAMLLDEAIRNHRARMAQLSAQAQVTGQVVAGDSARQILVDASVYAELQRAQAEAARLIAEAKAQSDRQKLDYESRIAELQKTIDTERARIRIEKADREADLERKEKEARAERQAKDVDSKLRQDATTSAAEKKLLIQRCQDSKVQQVLAPFLGKGYLRPDGNIGGGRGGKYDAIEPVPISYTDLVTLGALAPTSHGCAVLHAIAADYTDTMRPRWPKNSYGGWQDNPATRELVPKAQKLLIELGPTLVELELLQR